MKKYTMVLFVFAFVFGLFNINVNYVNAQVAGSAGIICPNGNTLESNCTTAPGGSVAVPLCPNGNTLASNCTVTSIGTPIPVPTCPVFNLGTKSEDVRAFQAQLNAQGASLTIDGSYGPQTRANAERYCNYPKPSSVVISGVKGPQTLDVNQQGTWTVTAYNKNGGDLSYDVIWGDSTSGVAGGLLQGSYQSGQSATFTHSYSQAGIYKPTFTVSSDNTIRCIQAPCPTNGGSAQTSLSVNVGNSPVPLPTDPIVKFNYFLVGENKYRFEVSSSQKFDRVQIEPDCSDSSGVYIFSSQLGKQTCRSFSTSLRPTNGISHILTLYSTDGRTHYATLWAFVYYKDVLIGTQALQIKVSPIENNSSSITVLSPNGGEIWTKGTTQTISWQDTNNISTHEIKLVPYNTSCNYGTCLPGVYTPYTIANTQGSSYNWPVGQTWENKNVPDGAYTIQVCQSGTNNCGLSKSYFKIISGTSTTPSITVLSPNGGEEWKQGEYKMISWQGNSQSNYYKIEIWGADTKVGDSNGIPVSVDGDAWRIVESVSGNSYRWKVGDVDCGGPCTGPIAGEKYRIVVRGKSSTSDLASASYTSFDWSDSPFSITSNTTQPSITIISPSNGTLKLDDFTTISLSSSGTSTINNPGVRLNLLGANGNVLGTFVQFFLNSNGPNYTWKVGQYYSSNGNNLLSASPGAGYMIQAVLLDGSYNVLYTATGAPFTIVSGTTTIPSIHITGASDSQSSDSSISVNVGNTFTISGMPQNLQGLSYWLGNGSQPSSGYYSRAYFFDQNFVNNNLCGNNDAPVNGVWTMTCTAKVAGSSTFYIEIYANGQTYKSNTVNITVSGTTTTTTSLSAACTATPLVDVAGYVLKWDAQVSGGTSPYNYSWSAYNDVSAYVGGSTTSSSFSASYSSTGTKQAVVRVTDSVGNTTSASCSSGGVLGTESFNFTQLLKFGSSGNEVMELQKFLTGTGYDVGIADGKFGLKTQEAVVQFQAANKLKGDGIVGPEVRALLNR